MNIYLISNNLLCEDICFDKNMDISEKMILRPLSVVGMKKCSDIKLNVDGVYSAPYASCIETAKYIADVNGCKFFLNGELSDCKIGNLGDMTLHELSEKQENDLSFKLEDGESLEDCMHRFKKFLTRVRFSEEKNVAVCIPRRILFSLVISYAKKSKNLDNRLVLTIDEQIVMESSSKNIEIFSLYFEDGIDEPQLKIFNFS